MSILSRLLWLPSSTRIVQEIDLPPDVFIQRLSAALETENSRIAGRVMGHRVQLWRRLAGLERPRAFGPMFVGVVHESAGGSQMTGHFQLPPTTRLFMLVWMSATTLIALAVIIAGLLQQSPDSRAVDALPFILPALLPGVGLAVLKWAERQGRADEAAVGLWLKQVMSEE
jgi:hypothetical protein